MRPAGLVSICAVLSLLVAGCSNNTTTSTTLTSATTIVSETVSGSLQVGGRSSHAFTTATAGTITVTVASLSAPVVVGLGIGAYTPSTGICSLSTSVNTTMGASAQLSVASATVSATVDAGTYCVEIYDAGNLTLATSFPAVTGTTSFTLTVVHPT